VRRPGSTHGISGRAATGHNRVLSALLGLLGATEGWLPSLRMATGGMAMAFAVIALIALINAAVWAVSRSTAQPEVAVPVPAE
jgi:hypothetical protein